METGNLFLGQQHQGVYWMCIEYRLSVTPEKIVVQAGTTKGTFYNSGPQVPTYTLNHYSYAELLHNKKLMERGSKKGITLRNIASNVHFTARLAMP